MAKKKGKFKDYFNFRFKSEDSEIEVRNFRVFDASLKAFFLYLFLSLPFFAFIYIVFANNSLSFYTTYRTDEGQAIWSLMQGGNGYLIYVFLIIGILAFFFTALGLFLFKPIITSRKVNKNKQNLYIIVMTVLAIASVLFFGISQFEYSRFFEYFQYSINFDNTDQNFAWAQPVTQYFIDHQTDNDYGWANNTVTLWVMFVQIMLSFAVFVILQKAVFTNYYNQEETENYISLKTNQPPANSRIMLNNPFFRSLHNFFKNDQRNLVIYISVGTVLVLLSSFIYSVLITGWHTNMSSMINWTYRITYLFEDLTGFVNGEGLDGYEQVFGVDANTNYYGTLFAISSLQIISMGLTIAVLFSFIVIFIQEKKVSYKFFSIQSILLFVLLLVTVSFMLVSKVYMFRLEGLWNEGDNNTRFLNIIRDAVGGQATLDRLFILFPPNDIFTEGGFSVEWLTRFSSLADAIITYAFIIGLFAIVFGNNAQLKQISKKMVRNLKAKIRQNEQKGNDETYQETTPRNH